MYIGFITIDFFVTKHLDDNKSMCNSSFNSIRGA